MSATVKDLIGAIASGKSSMIQQAFESVMAQKTQLAIDSYRQAVIDNTFNPDSVNESEGPDDTDDSSISEEFDLSEYTLEEIQDFMESEEFSALDELSKSTLVSYIKKSAGNAASATRAAGIEAASRNPNRWERMNSKEDRAQKRLTGVSKAAEKLTK